MQQLLAQQSALFLAHRLSLHAYVRGLVRDPVLAEDLFQETYLALAQACEKGTVIDDLPRWSRGVARNLALQHWKQQRHHRLVPDPELVDRIDQAFAEAGDQIDDEWDQRRRALAECTEELPAPARRLLTLRYVENQPIASMTETLSRSAGSLMTALSRLRTALAACIAQRLRARVP